MWLLACATVDSVPWTPSDPPEGWSADRIGPGPFDPIAIRAANYPSTAFEPVIESADGERVPMSPVASRGRTIGWVATDGLPPGKNRIRAVVGHDIPWDWTFETEDWTRPIDRQALYGRTFVTSLDDTVALGEQAGGLASLLADGDVYLRLDAPKPGAGPLDVPFDLYYDGTDGLCRVTHGTGTLLPSGEFVWARDEILARIEPEPLDIGEVEVRARFISPERAVSMEIRAMLDTSALVPKDPGRACELMEKVGYPCQVCDGGGRYCVDVWLAAGTLDAVADLPDPPPCAFDSDNLGLSEEDDVPTGDDDCGVGCDGDRGWIPGAAILALLRRRREGVRR